MNVKDMVQVASLSGLNVNVNIEIEHLKTYLHSSFLGNCFNYLKRIETKNNYLQKVQEDAQHKTKYHAPHKTIEEKNIKKKLDQ